MVTMNDEQLKKPDEVRLYNIVDMGLTFSAMIRLFQKGSKKSIRTKIVAVLPEIKNSESHEHFKEKHHSFCIWGIQGLKLAERERQGKILKMSSPPSYGQVAKTLDVVLKVVIYYQTFPD